MEKKNGVGIVLCAFGVLLAGAEAGAQATSTGSGQAWPVKPVRLIVPSSPGGGTDISARLIAPRLGQELGQQVVVENRAGAGTMIGSEAVARAAPDGYTLLMGISTLTINPHILRKLPFDAMKDLAPVTQAVVLPNMLVSHPSLPAKTVKELVAFARARPGQLNFGSAGVGTNPHLCMELFLSMTGTKMVHVPYKGVGPASVDLVAGHVSLMMANMLTAGPHIKSGRLRAYGVTGARRSAAAPEYPTIAEAGVPGYEAVQWYGVLVPAATPREIVTRLHGALARVLGDPAMKDRFAADGAEAVGNSPEAFAAVMRNDFVKWGKVVKAAGIKPE
jgi:tripartite-type tricarboxylate transporter receptor subunit TctC